MKELIHSMPSLSEARKRTKNKIERIRDSLIIPDRLRLFANGKKYFIMIFGERSAYGKGTKICDFVGY